MPANASRIQVKLLPTRSLFNQQQRRLVRAIGAIVLMIVVGATGFHLIEGVSWIDSIYNATQTVTTVGYGDIPPRAPAGKIFATVFMLTSVGTVLYALTVLAQTVLQSEIVETLGLKQKRKEMERLKNHYIVCGAGRVGRRIIGNLQKQNQPFVIIEQDEKKVAEFAEAGANVLIADATLEENLRQAGAARASGLASCLPNDADNVYVVLTARDLNADLHIVARAVEEQAEPKLIRAGANRVVAPVIIGGQSMARSLLKPTIADFMDSIVAENFDLVFEEIAVDDSSAYIDKELGKTNLTTELNLLIVAVRRKNGEMIFQPSTTTRIFAGDLLIVIGRAEQVQKLMDICKH